MINHTDKYDMTILIPVYNEEENMNRLEKEMSGYIGEASIKTCVLFIDDSSSDKSLNHIIEICEKNPHFYYISLKKRGGLSAALKAGIDICNSRYLGYIDADLQTDPKDFDLLLNYADNHELVTGIRKNRKDTWFKICQSKIANGFRRFMTKDGVEDTGCPLKVIHSETAKQIPFFSGMHRFLPALVIMVGGRIKQIPVNHFQRIAGKSKYNLWNRLVAPFVDCFAYRWMKRRFISYEIERDNLK